MNTLILTEYKVTLLISASSLQGLNQALMSMTHPECALLRAMLREIAGLFSAKLVRLGPCTQSKLVKSRRLCLSIAQAHALSQLIGLMDRPDPYHEAICTDVFNQLHQQLTHPSLPQILRK